MDVRDSLQYPSSLTCMHGHTGSISTPDGSGSRWLRVPDVSVHTPWDCVGTSTSSCGGRGGCENRRLVGDFVADMDSAAMGGRSECRMKRSQQCQTSQKTSSRVQLSTALEQMIPPTAVKIEVCMFHDYEYKFNDIYIYICL